MAAIIKCLLLYLCFNVITADDIERTARRGVVLKLLREMVNQTKADSLNLPANASSIRENITDTFSCENRTYGYYADVDNGCQVFHVCLTSQSTTGRNTTYRWSFICPNETIFNQEVLTCTRPRDSIDCEESPMFYHVNNDIGKVQNTTESEGTHRRKPKPVKKQNMIVEKLMSEVKNEDLIAEEFEEEMLLVEEGIKMNDKPIIHDIGEVYEMKGGRMENARLTAERSLRRGRKMNRGSYRFKDNLSNNKNLYNK